MTAPTRRGLWLAILAVIAVLTGSAGMRLAGAAAIAVPEVPELPEKCPGPESCAFSALALAPTVGRVSAAMGPEDLEIGAPLGPEWDGVVDPANRRFVQRSLTAVLAGRHDGFEDEGGYGERYSGLRTRAWAGELARRRIEFARAAQERETAVAARDRAILGALFPTPLDGLAAGVLAWIGALAVGRRGARVELGEALRISGRPSFRVALVAMALVLGASWVLNVAEALEAPRPPRPEPSEVPECPGDPGCGFSGLADAPNRWKLGYGLARCTPGSLAELGPEWGGIVEPAHRRFLERVLACADGPPAPQIRGWSEIGGDLDEYQRILDRAWAVERERRAGELAAEDEDRLAVWQGEVARWDAELPLAFAPTRRELALIGFAGTIGAAGALGRARRREVEIGPRGVALGGERIGWDRIEAVDGYEGVVEVRLFDGGVRRGAGLWLTSAEAEALETEIALVRPRTP